MPQERFEDPEVIYMKREAAPGSEEAAEAAADDSGGLDDGIEDYRGSTTKVRCSDTHAQRASHMLLVR